MQIKLQNLCSEPYIFAHKYSLFSNENAIYFPKTLISLQLSHLLIDQNQICMNVFNI